MSLGVETKKKMFRVFLFFVKRERPFENAENALHKRNTRQRVKSFFISLLFSSSLPSSVRRERGGKTLCSSFARARRRRRFYHRARARVVLNILQRHGNEREREIFHFLDKTRERETVTNKRTRLHLSSSSSNDNDNDDGCKQRVVQPRQLVRRVGHEQRISNRKNRHRGDGARVRRYRSDSQMRDAF